MHSQKARKTLEKIRKKCKAQTGSPEIYFRNDERFRVFILNRSEEGEIRGRVYLQMGTKEKKISNFIISREGNITNGPNHLKGLLNG